MPRRQAWAPYGAFPPGTGGGRRRSGWGAAREQQALLSLLALLVQQVARLERKPPVTILLVITQVLFFLRPEGFDWVPSTHGGCLLPTHILSGQWGRLLWSPFLHADTLHLYYNMSSLLWKLQGSQLEPRLGATAFVRLVTELALVSNGLYLGLAVLLAQHYPAVGWPLMRTCAVGFSGILFGLKVVLNHNSPGWSEIYGIALPTKYACWAELVVVQLLVPEASFWGHLCGILAGLLHVLLTSRLHILSGSSGVGPPHSSGAGGGSGVQIDLDAAVPNSGAASSAGGSKQQEQHDRRGSEEMATSKAIHLAATACSLLLYVAVAAAMLGNPGKASFEAYLLKQQQQKQGLGWDQQSGGASQPLEWLGAQLAAHLPVAWQLPRVCYRSLILLSLGQAQGSWHWASALAGWQPLPKVLQPAAERAAAAADAVAAAAAWAADCVGWLGWLLCQQHGLHYGVTTAAEFVQASLLHPPPGTLALGAAMCIVWLLWRLLPPARAVRWLELPRPCGCNGGSSSSTSVLWQRWWRQAMKLLLAGLSHERLAHLLLNLASLALAGGAAERQLSAAICQLNSLASQEWRSCEAAAAAVFVAAFLGVVAAAYAAALLLVPRVGTLRRSCPPLLGWKGADPAIYALLLALLLQEGHQHLKTAATAAAASSSSAAATTLAASLATCSLRLLPRPLLLHSASLADRATQALALGRWFQRRRGLAPPAVLLAATRVAAEQMLLPAGQQPGRGSRAMLLWGGRQKRCSFLGTVLAAPLWLSFLLLRAAVGLVAHAARLLSWPLPRLRLLRRMPRPHLAIIAAAASIGACQVLLLGASRATLAALETSLLFTTSQLLLTALCLPLLATSCVLR